MPEYLHPGVYIEEVPRGPRPIEGVATSTAAMLGAAERGGSKPQLITSFAEYTRYFGAEYRADTFLAASVQGFFENGGKRVFVCRVVSRSANAAQVDAGGLRIQARGAGGWAKRLWVKLGESSARDERGAPVGYRLRAALFAPGAAPFDCFESPGSTHAPQLIEDHDNLTLDAMTPGYRGNSALVEVSRIAGTQPTATPQFNGTLAGGTDGGNLEVADFSRSLTSLEDGAFDEVSLLYAPGADRDTRLALIKHCETSRFRFAVLDVDQLSILATIDPRDDNPDTAYAACYWPWLLVKQPGSKQTREVPPGGHILGLYARTDSERGVHKAPANEGLRGVVDLAQDLNARQQDVLQELGINAIRKFPGRGIRVWGARTLSGNTEGKYVNLRRLLMFLERSIYRGTQWVVFEPNGEPLWAQVADAIRLFLRGQWLSGALLGTTEDQAFFVACDRSTMTQVDIQNGRLICQVGVAVMRPAEFVVLRISQTTVRAPS